MVRALLDGRKTQTRRVVKPQPKRVGWYTQDDKPGVQFDWHEVDEHNDPIDSSLRCPYGAPGDRLWVRETSRAEELSTGQDGVTYTADNAFRPIENNREAGERWLRMHNYCGRRGALVPGIHMPRWASRLTLEVTEVRVERAQDISEADAIAEGVWRNDDFGDEGPAKFDRALCPKCGGSLLHNAVGPGLGVILDVDCRACDTAVKRFKHLWQSINDRPWMCWADNPWVWVVGLKVVS